jgi:hypothetical protein
VLCEPSGPVTVHMVRAPPGTDRPIGIFSRERPISYQADAVEQWVRMEDELGSWVFARLSIEPGSAQGSDGIGHNIWR